MNHETNDINKDPYSAQHDMVFTEEFTSVRGFTDQNYVPVNSRHHQAVSDYLLPGDLAVLARHRSFSKGNKIGESDMTIEMIAHRALPIVTVQMHPEDMYEPSTNRLMRSVIKSLIIRKRSII